MRISSPASWLVVGTEVDLYQMGGLDYLKSLGFKGAVLIPRGRRYTQAESEMAKYNLLLIGGPVANVYSEMVMNQKGWKYDSRQNAFVGPSGQRASYILIEGKNPFNPSKKAVVVAGLNRQLTRQALNRIEVVTGMSLKKVALIGGGVLGALAITYLLVSRRPQAIAPIREIPTRVRPYVRRVTRKVRPAVTRVTRRVREEIPRVTRTIRRRVPL